MFTHILVPLDGSALAENVLPHLIMLARVGAPRVTLLRVLDPSSGAATGDRPVDPFDWQLRKAEVETYLNAVAERLAQSGVQAQVEMREGRAAETVIEFTEETQADLILLSSHGESGLTGWNVSGVVQKIILRVRRSVMIVRAYQPVSGEPGEMQYRQILVPLDGSARAEVVLPFAAAIARAHDGCLIAVHVVQQPEMPRRTPPTQEDMQIAGQLVERNRVEADLYLKELADRVDVSLQTRLAVEENVTRALRQLVESENIDLVILSAHGYSGDTQVPYGSVVVNFIAYGTTPLLVVQDLPPERLEPTMAEISAQERGRR